MKRVERAGYQMKSMKKRLLSLVLVLAMVLSIPAMVASAAENVQKVKPLSWKCTLKQNVRVNGKIYRKGSTVVCVNTNPANRKVDLSLGGKTVRVAKSAVRFRSALCTSRSQGDYNNTTKLYYVNKVWKLSSSTKYCIWVSLDKQRVNIYRGSKGNWKLIRVMKCSTGVGNGTPQGMHRIGPKYRRHRGCQYYCEYRGSGFHAWPGSTNTRYARKTLGYNVASHGCIRLYWDDAKWFYNTIPSRTTCWIY